MIITTSMPGTTLSDLPVEVHVEILKYAFDFSRWIKEVEPKVEWEWIEPDNRKPSQFPYNVAAVCRLWLSILTTIPECWTRVIIDVASDPRDFLDVFLWSKDLPKLAVTITNSHTPDPEDFDYSELERRRVSAIVDALRPHASRCRTITFEVTFLTSLPSPMIFLDKDAPHLRELVLECKINNAGPPDDYSRSCDLGICEPLQTPAHLSFPSLSRLAMTGFWFMFIASHPYTAEWFKTHRCDVYRISCFEFQKKGQYTLQNFIMPFTCLKSHITLFDLSLDHNGAVLEDKDGEVSAIGVSMTFQNVSSDVLKYLFFLANIYPSYLTFDNCTFPDGALETKARFLTLKNIPLSGPANSGMTANSTNSWRFLAGWSGSQLDVHSCPSFDDNALLVLSSCRFQFLSLFDSPNYTVNGVRQFLETRNKLSAEPRSVARGNYQPLDLLEIDSNGPFPSEADQEWFRTSLYTRSMDFNWYYRDQEKSVQQSFETREDDWYD